MSSDLIKHVSDASFDADVLQSETPVLVDYWASWCGPCLAIAPHLEAIATDYQGRLQVVKMDVEANKETPVKYFVRGIPALSIFKGGQVVATLTGSNHP
jgi:thioredoxin 1